MLNLQDGGTLQQDALYVVRDCDERLRKALMTGEYCLVLAPRGIGKSSLLVHTAAQLQRQGIDCAYIDLYGMLGDEDKPQQFFDSLITRLGDDLNIEVPPAYLEPETTPSHRLYRFIHKEILARPDRRVVFLLDEIETITRSQSIPTDQVLGLLRALYNERARRPEFSRLAVGLFGAVNPEDLLSDELRTPFNIGTAIQIADFSWEEMLQFRQALPFEEAAAVGLLREVFRWTGGHPYMTQCLLRHLCESNLSDESAAAARVERAVTELYFNPARTNEPSLGKIDRFFRRQEQGQKVPQMLELYARLLAGERVPAIAADRTQMALCMTGLARVEGPIEYPVLKIRNLIMARRFDLTWVQLRLLERRFCEPLQRWRQSGKQAAYLLSGSTLVEARQWALAATDLTREEREFLFLSEESDRAQQQAYLSSAQQSLARTRHSVAGAVVIALLAGGGGLLSTWRLYSSGPQKDICGERACPETSSTPPSFSAVHNVASSVYRPPGAPTVLTTPRKQESPEHFAVPSSYERSVRAESANDKITRAELARQTSAPKPAAQPGRKPQQETTKEEMASAAAVAPSVPEWAMRLAESLEGLDPQGELIEEARQALKTEIEDALRANPTILRPGFGVHTERIKLLGYRSDGTVLTVGNDERLVLSDAFSGKVRYQASADGGGVLWPQISRDGRILAYGGRDGRVYVWFPEEGRPRPLLGTHDVPVAALDISPDGSRVASVDSKGLLVLHDLKDPQQPRSFSNAGADLSFVSFSSDGRWLVASGQRSQFLLMSMSELGAGMRRLGKYPGGIFHAAFSSSANRLIVVGAKFQRPQAWDLARRDPIPLPDSIHHDDLVDLMAISPNGQWVVTASLDGSVRLWHAEDGRFETKIDQFDEGLPSAAFLPNSRQVVVGSRSGEIRLIDFIQRHRLITLKPNQGAIALLAVSPDGENVVFSNMDAPQAFVRPLSDAAMLRTACALLHTAPAGQTEPRACSPRSSAP